MLRDYQQRAIDELYQWFADNKTGNPCLVLPTGSGKSHIVAALCKGAVQAWPSTRILMLTHQKELITQNAERMREHWPNAPLGIYSASVGQRDVDSITFAGIQTVAKRAHELEHQDLVIIDECHLLNNAQQGNYRKLIADLLEINPSLRVVGLTATPWRLGQGKLTDGDNALFSDLIEPVTVSELIERGFLSLLRSKLTGAKVDTSGIKKRGGEFIAKDAAEASDAITDEAVDEIIERAEGRQHWLIFCASVAHAEHVAEAISSHGIKAEYLHGGHTKRQREDILERFTTGQTQALANCAVLTTGFDYPDIDLVALLRPTMSPSLYVQMVGRGMRLKSNTDHCLVLDFAGNIDRHGPITNVNPPKERGKGGGDSPIKICPQCSEQLHTSVMVCPDCGHVFESAKKEYKLSNADIMGIEPQEMQCTHWQWSKHVSRKTQKEMLKVRYYGGLADPIITEYLPIHHGGYAGDKAVASLGIYARRSNVNSVMPSEDTNEIAQWMNTGNAPESIKYMKNGKFYDIKERIWTTQH